VIIPIQGKDLPNRERFGKQDPFILFRLGNVSKRGVTDVRGGQRPVWKDDQVKKISPQALPQLATRPDPNRPPTQASTHLEATAIENISRTCFTKPTRGQTGGMWTEKE